MPDNAIANYNKQLEDKYKELESIINTDTKTERDYITKHPSQRDQYDIAFGKLNPESRAKADRFGSLVGEIQTINNNIVDLESAKHFFKNLYSQQRAETNSGFDNLQQSNALSNDIALSTALATAGGMGASGIQSAGLKAQANNLLAATQQKAEAERQDALAKITQAEAQAPLQLANIGQLNDSITRAQTAPTYGGGGGRRAGGHRHLPPTGGGSEGQDSDEAKLIAMGFKKNPDGTWHDHRNNTNVTKDALLGSLDIKSNLNSNDKHLISTDNGQTIQEITQAELEELGKRYNGKYVFDKVEGVYMPFDSKYYYDEGNKSYSFWEGLPWIGKENRDFVFNHDLWNQRSNMLNVEKRIRHTKRVYDLSKANFIAK